MSDDLSTLTSVTPDPGKYQRVKGQITGIDDKQTDRTHTVGVPRLPTLAVLALALSACASGGASPPPALGPSKPPQVVYRIDDHRYFELTPDETCFDNMLYFVDTIQGIHSAVVKFDAVMNRTTLIIDAANDQYLVAPVTRGGINCSSGGEGCSGDQLPYSIDGGRTWKRVWAHSSRNGVLASGSTAYNLDGVKLMHGLDLMLPKPQSNDWKYLPDFVFTPHIAPVDVKVTCNSQGIRSVQ